ncbi:MAG: hypothetical protein HKN82_10740 [Akkermansiaceae bacterium]|nr:hypothetical protein [Akkermansiaceae bacterium]NNM28314.1 hypothetical protein [Akkermansiaceae bacterium]
MSLRQQLSEILPDILPANPKEATKGTELIRMVRLRLEGDYSDASLRYHFSIMSCDPASPIAKVEKGQGYYRRAAPVPALAGAQDLLSMTQGRLDDYSGDQGAVDVVLARVRKFRAVASRYCEVNGRFPYIFREVLAKDSPLGNLWKYPDMVVVDWEAGEPVDNGVLLDPELLSLKRSLGIPPYRLQSVSLRLQSNHDLYREEFFQSLSVSLWTQGGEIFYASPIEDEALADSIRHLSNRYGIGVTTFGLTPEMLDDLPGPEHILTAQPRETEALMERLDVRRIASPRLRDHVDWATLNTVRSENEEVRRLFTWLGMCIENERAVPFADQ